MDRPIACLQLLNQSLISPANHRDLGFVIQARCQCTAGCLHWAHSLPTSNQQHDRTVLLQAKFSPQLFLGLCWWLGESWANGQPMNHNLVFFQPSLQCLFFDLFRGHEAFVHLGVEPGRVTTGQIGDHGRKRHMIVLVLPERFDRLVLHQRMHGHHDVWSELSISFSHGIVVEHARYAKEQVVHPCGFCQSEHEPPQHWILHHEAVGLGCLIEWIGRMMRPQVYDGDTEFVWKELLKGCFQSLCRCPMSTTSVTHEDQHVLPAILLVALRVSRRSCSILHLPPMMEVSSCACRSSCSSRRLPSPSVASLSRTCRSRPARRPARHPAPRGSRGGTRTCHVDQSGRATWKASSGAAEARVSSATRLASRPRFEWPIVSIASIEITEVFSSRSWTTSQCLVRIHFDWPPREHAKNVDGEERTKLLWIARREAAIVANRTVDGGTATSKTERLPSCTNKPRSLPQRRTWTRRYPWHLSQRSLARIPFVARVTTMNLLERHIHFARHAPPTPYTTSGTTFHAFNATPTRVNAIMQLVTL